MEKNGDHFRVGIISGSIWGSLRVGDHFGIRIISGAVQYLCTPLPLEQDLDCGRHSPILEARPFGKSSEEGRPWQLIGEASCF